MCLSDFVAPGDHSNPTDYIGLFACTAGIGSRELCNTLEKDRLDDYSSIMVIFELRNIRLDDNKDYSDDRS